MIILRLALLSLWNRRNTVLLTVCGIAVSVALLLGVDKIRTDLRSGFANTISGADLIVGARSGPVNLLLYSIFRIGDATNGVSWDIYRRIAAHPDVAWTIPLSLKYVRPSRPAASSRATAWPTCTYGGWARMPMPAP